MGITGVIFVGMSILLDNVQLVIPTTASNYKITSNTVNFWIGFYLILCNICYNQTNHLLYLKLLTRIHLSLTIVGLLGIFIFTVSNEVFYEGYTISGHQISLLDERISRVRFLLSSLILFALGQSVYLFNLAVGSSYIKQKQEEDGTAPPPFY